MPELTTPRSTRLRLRPAQLEKMAAFVGLKVGSGLHLAAAALLGFRATLAQHDLLRVCVRLRRIAARVERLPRDDAVNLDEDLKKRE